MSDSHVQSNAAGSSARTALVLSAGGMFGSYQAGIWLELSKYFKPDLIVGASIGSVNGWLIASGLDGEQLTDRWLNMAVSEVRWRLPRGIGKGIIDSSSVDTLFQEMCDSLRPQTPYGVVTVEYRTMKPKLFRYPEVTWEHIAASCAVPFFLRQPKLEGRMHADGGLLNPLPLWAALEMGATRVISVNLLENRPWIVRAVANCARAYSGFRDPGADHITHVNISPSQVLGGPKDTIYWSHENARRWIELGQKDAAKHKHLIVECLERK
ncbi:MAG TPA: patatin-like phospholipase family protein [Bryobacteraceae bacterium]|nr:patatin-like phospholipase family protein [Bryobacteraceae bacterium]